ncbi:two-component regulator propeller domain-containing protein [Corallococcus macrosporus]|nr:two-component regulator propeller domain-containing protein [Corallococcus macrosporus]
MSLLSAGCNDGSPTVEPGGEEPVVDPTDGNEVPTLPPPGSLPDSGTLPPDEDGGTPDAGETPDAGTTPDPDAGTGETPNAGPWPTDAVLDYTRSYGVGKPQSVGVDEGLNLWFLDGRRIGVLRPGDTAPTWTTGVGQAREPFGPEAFATGSTVICGGAAGRAYVGYAANEMKRAEGIEQRTYIPWKGEAGYSPERFAEYMKGDLDAVRVQPDGSVALEEHLWRTTGASNKDRQAGIHNTNDFHYEEDRSVLNCARVTRGRDRGDLYITTNHGVTRIQGLTYNSHRHPGWYLYENGSEWGSLQCPYMHGLGIAPNGDVLVANEQMLGVLVPSPKLEEWDREFTWEGPTPWKFKSFNEQLNGQATDDYWRAFEQVSSGRYYLGSAEYGVWALTPKSRSAGNWSKVAGLPTNRIQSLKATDDGALYIGTNGAGLWRLEADGTTLAPVKEVSGQRVLQMVYEPTVKPSMLLVLTDQGLTVLRGP